MNRIQKTFFSFRCAFRKEGCQVQNLFLGYAGTSPLLAIIIDVRQLTIVDPNECHVAPPSHPEHCSRTSTPLLGKTNHWNRKAQDHPKSTVYKDSTTWHHRKPSLTNLEKKHPETPVSEIHYNEYNCRDGKEHKAPHREPLPPLHL